MWSLFRNNARQAKSASRTPQSIRPRLEALEDRCLLTAGALDPTFGNGAGYVTTPVANYNVTGNTPLIQTDGTIIEVGRLTPSVQPGAYEAGLVKYNPNGSLNTSFGSNGVVIGPQSDQTTRAAQYPPPDTTGNAGKIVVSGVGTPVNQNGVTIDPFSIARFNPDGSLDTSFGSNGIATINFGNAFTSSDGSDDVVVQPDGRILALGNSGPQNSYADLVLARFNPDGSLDTTFGQGGWIVSQGQITEALSMALQPDGKIVVTGYMPNTSYHGLEMGRFNADGSLDTSFGNGGFVTNSSIYGTLGVEALALYPAEGTANDGKIVVGGQTSSYNTFELARYNTNGSLDTTFGNGGIVTTSIGRIAQAQALAVQANGQIDMAGYEMTTSGNLEFLLARYNPDGSLDSTFGAGGIGATPNVSGSGRGITFQPNGDIVVAGTAGAGGANSFALVRYLGDGPSFSVTGFPASATAGTPETITVTALNAGGTVNTGYAGTIQFSSSDPHAVLPANYTFTAADQGVHSFIVTLVTAGSQSLTVADTSNDGTIGGESGITITPAAAAQIVLSAPSSVRHGTKFSVTVTVEDAYGNVATGYLGTIHFTSSDSSATLPQNYTFTASDAGVHTFSNVFILRTRGKQTLTVTDTQNSALTATDSINVT